MRQRGERQGSPAVPPAVPQSPCIPVLPPSAPLQPEIRKPAPPEPDFLETLSAQVVWQIEFDPVQGGFPDSALRERVWNALNAELEQGGNVYLAMWTLDKRGFTVAERNKAHKHFMAAMAAEGEIVSGKGNTGRA